MDCLENIKFRGQDKNGRWHYGFYQRIMGEHFIGQERIMHIIRNDLDLWVEVIPETVSLFTGLKDCVDVDIYGGDIFKNIKFPEVGIHYARWANEMEYAGWSLVSKGKEPIGDLFLYSNFENLKVIGNMTDNPELYV